MKIVLTILAVLQLIGGLIGCLFALGSNPLISLLFLGGGIVGAVPYVALISVLEDIAVLKEEQGELKGKLRHFIPAEGVPSADEQTGSAGSQPLSREVALFSWKCLKCQTINKPNTSSCSGCGALFSPWINGEG